MSPATRASAYGGLGGLGGDFDVAVVGAGPAGSAAARWLALTGARVALIDRSGFDRPRFGESLAPAVQPWLARLGVWSDFLAQRPMPSYGTRSCWGHETPHSHSHLASPWGCGWHIDRSAFDRMLAEAACRAGAFGIFGSTLVGCEADGPGWRLVLGPSPPPGAPRVLRARLLIDATGRPARCAAWLGARRRPIDRLVAVAVRFDANEPQPGGHVLVESTADGWWYSAPLPGGGMVAMLFTDGDLCRSIALQSPGSWNGRLAASTETRRRIAGARPRSLPRLVYAGSHRLVRTDSHGDEAMAVDPISGSGILRALSTASEGALAARAALDGSVDAVARYEAARDAEFGPYLRERASYYGFEGRYAQHPFWSRRNSPQAAAGPAPVTR